jgi:hypothetical protein
MPHSPPGPAGDVRFGRVEEAMASITPIEFPTGRKNAL